MIKNTHLLVLLLLFCISFTHAQTVQIENAVKAPGDIEVKVEMLGFTGSNGSVQSIQFQIAFDDNLFYFKGISNINSSFAGWVVPENGSSSPVTISYINITGHDINTKIFDLLFGYAGGFSGDISFIPSGCEIARGGLLTMTNVAYINGSVTQAAAVASVNLGASQQVAVTTLVTVPVHMQGSGLIPCNAFTYKIGYDPAKLTFVQLTNSILGGTLVASATQGVLTISWNGAINSLSGAPVFNIEFIYNGGGDAHIDFLPGSQIFSSALAIIPTAYTGTTVQNLPGTSSISMPDLVGTLNTGIAVPITLDFTGVGFIGGVNLIIGYSDSQLIYNGFTTGTLGTGITASASGGEITIVWNKPSNTASLNGVLLNLNFTNTSTAGVSPVTFNAGSVITQTNLSNVVLTYLNGSVTTSSYSVSGILSYLNASATPLSNTTLLLKQGGVTVTQTTTDGAGNFFFNNLANGEYTLEGESAKPWGGVNASDALLVLKHFTGLITLSPLKVIAADVNASNYVNTSDALMIAKRFVGMISSFNSGDWLFENPVVTLPLLGDMALNINGLCYGDLDGSFTPAFLKESPVEIETGGNVYVSKDEIIVLPIRSTTDLEIGSISLRLGYPEQSLDILDVVSPGNDGNIVFHQEDGQLNIAWFSLIPKQLKAGDVILQIKARVLQINSDPVVFTVLPGSEFGNQDAVAIENVKFGIPSLFSKESEGNGLVVYPNPITSNASISYTVPEPGYLNLVIYNLYGEELFTLLDTNVPEGKYQQNWIPENIAGGMYFCKLIFTGKSIIKTSVTPVIITK